MFRSLILVFLLPFTAIAQRLEIDLFSGIANYQGELQAQRVTLEHCRPAFSFNLKVEVVKNLYVRAGITYASLAGFDATNNVNNRARNLSFQSTLFEYALGLEYRPFKIARFSPYIFIGAGAFKFNPYTYYTTANGSQRVYLQPLSTEGQGLSQYPQRQPYKLFQYCVPYGIGVKYEFNSNLNVGVELRQTRLFTDYLDDVSTTYVDRATLLAAKGQVAVDLAFRGDEFNGAAYPAEGRGRGNPAANDSYYFGGITVGLRFKDDAGNFSLGGLFNNEHSLFKRKGGSGYFLKQTNCPRF